MEDEFDKIELCESQEKRYLKINNTKIKHIASYEIKRDTDIVEVTLKISVPFENFTTNNI